jgi:hypothetical protein
MLAYSTHPIGTIFAGDNPITNLSQSGMTLRLGARVVELGVLNAMRGCSKAASCGSLGALVTKFPLSRLTIATITTIHELIFIVHFTSTTAMYNAE